MKLYRAILSQLYKQSDSVRKRAESIAQELKHTQPVQQVQDTELMDDVAEFLKGR